MSTLGSLSSAMNSVDSLSMPHDGSHCSSSCLLARPVAESSPNQEVDVKERWRHSGRRSQIGVFVLRHHIDRVRLA
eukprot:scaffold489_cov259-Pinguiococcus_pyrenoidosus.AAC.15